MEDTRKLRDLILDQCDAKNIRLEELAKKTGMPEQYLDAIINDVKTRLPAFPYIRAHLIRLAELLGLEADLLLQRYRNEFTDKLSGRGDTLPGNRFALPPSRRRYAIIAGGILLLIAAYTLSKSGVFGRPQLVITMPPVGQDPFVTSSSTMVLSGHVGGGNALFINDQAVAPEDDGSFQKEYHLLPEINIIEFRVKRFLGGEATIVREVYYEEARPAVERSRSVTSQDDEAPPLENEEASTTAP